ncbi:MAG: glycosyltransferase [Desulfobacterales bacterium]|nr:glycosyltransferase [Desulfobacterales bacterium]
MKKIILVAGDLDPTKSYEYQNFQKPLENMGYTVIPFDFLKTLQAIGREQMNKKLLLVVKESQPDIVIFVPHTDQFIPEIVDEIGKYSLTFCYFFDDIWRIDYSRFWAKHFKFVTTSDVNGLRKFRDSGFTNVIYSPFACNTDVYSMRDLPKIYDVTFVGQYHPYREWLINHLKKQGIDVQVWGKGWPSGMINLEDMIDIFNQSRINLNLSNCVSWDVRYLFTPLRSLKTSMRKWLQVFRALKRNDMKTVEQVKGRHFEINACGGFQLSYLVEGLEKMYSIGEEISIFVSPEDLIEKTKYYLKHENERESIAKRGYARSMIDHTMEDRFKHIFEQIGLVDS